MKFRYYLKAVGIYYLLSAVFALASLVLLIFSAKGVFEAHILYGKAPTVAMYLRGLAQVAGSFQFSVKILLVSLTGFFVARNFRLVYAKAKECLRWRGS